MNYNQLNEMCGWERQKALYLIQTAEEIGMDVDGYGELGANPNSGNVYLWSEDYPFCLYMPINCDLKESDIWVCYSDPYDGEEIEDALDEFNNLAAIEAWCEGLQEKSEEKENA